MANLERYGSINLELETFSMETQEILPTETHNFVSMSLTPPGLQMQLKVPPLSSGSDQLGSYGG